MKKVYKYSILLIAAFLFAPLATRAQNNSQDPTNTLTGLGFTKNVEPTGDKAYEITMTAFTTGSSISQEISASVPVDIVLVLDCSQSMTANVTTTTETVNELSASQQLSYNNNNYRITVNGQELYLRGRREDLGSGNRHAYSYYYYYGPDDNPTNDGTAPIYTSEGWYNGRNDYGSGSEPTVQQILNAVSGATRIYTITTTEQNQGSRLNIMKQAAQAFVETVYASNPPAPTVENPIAHPMHQIAIVQFGTQAGTRIVRNLTELTSQSIVNTIKGEINDLGTTIGTESALGLHNAYDILNAVSGTNDDHHAKVTVFFTDGEPGMTDKFSANIGREAVHWAYQLKHLRTTLYSDINTPIPDPENEGQNMTMDSKVYCVALLSGNLADETSTTNAETSGTSYTTVTTHGSNNSVTHDVRRYLHYVSSNYDFDIADYSTNTSYYFQEKHSGATQCSGTGHPEGNTDYGNEDPHGYYFLTGGNNLQAIFTTIAGEASGTPDIPLKLKSTDVVAVDVVSHSFKLPDGADASAIQVLVAPFTGIDEEGTYTDAQKSRLEHYQFGTPKTFAEYRVSTLGKDTVAAAYVKQQDNTYVAITPAATIDPNNRQKISVTGFNYADNWCGYDELETSTGVVERPHGYQLVIKVPIEVDPANPGGASVETNDPTSGIYITNEDGTTTFAGFPQPVVTLPNIIVRKYGLDRVHESASFKLEKMNDAGTAVDTSVKPYFFIVTHDGSRRGFDFAQVKLQEPGTYRVTETDWAWNYTTTVSKDNLTGPTISPTSGGDVSQSYMIRTIGAETEQEDDATGLKGVIFDFKNTKNTPDISVSNYNESNKVNIFPTKSVAPATK